MKALRKLAPRVGVSVAWLETGEEDSAVALAQLVLEYEGKLPDFAIVRARRVLRKQAPERLGQAGLNCAESAQGGSARVVLCEPARTCGGEESLAVENCWLRTDRGSVVQAHRAAVALHP